MILASLLASSKYIIVNKDLIQILGLNEAIILGELCSEYSYWANINKLEDNEYFYSTRDNIQKNTGITPHFQRTAMKNLEEKGIIYTKKKGIPCKTYYKIDEVKVIEYLKKAQLFPENSVVNEMNDKTSTEETTSTQQEKQQELNDVDINNNNINNKKNNKEEHTHAEALETKKQFAEKVFMTQAEHEDLLKQYGPNLASQLIEQLNLYKQAKGQNYDNDYAAILRWVTTRIREMEKEQQSYNNFKNKQKANTKTFANYEQREYSPDFLNSLICNFDGNAFDNNN